MSFRSISRILLYWSNMDVKVTDPVNIDIIRQIEQREMKGLMKYGMTVSQNPLSTNEWIDHAIEEALDFVVYLKRLKNQLKMR